MAKSKKPISEERREQLRQQLAKAREVKKAKLNATQQQAVDQAAQDFDKANDPERSQEQVIETKPENQPLPQGKSLEETVAAMQETISQLQNQLANSGMNQQERWQATAETRAVNPNQVTNAGVQGVVYKYPIDKGHYPDPTDRLYDDPLLKRYSMRDNFIFTWDVVGETYEKHNITYSEPRFEVHLYRVIFDEDGITPTGKLALVNRHYQHEDELVARMAAQKLGLEGVSFEELMNEVRYQRIRTWLLALFQKPKIEQHNRRPVQMVIDGKVTEVYDTEAIVAGSTGIEKASSIESEVRI